MDINADDTKTSAVSTILTSRRQIGQYQVVAKLGEGDLGEIYRPNDVKLGRDVALRVPPLALALASQSEARMVLSDRNSMAPVASANSRSAVRPWRALQLPHTLPCIRWN